MRQFTQILLFLIFKPYLMASPCEQEFKNFKPKPPPWLSTGRKATLELIIMTLESLINIGLKKK